MIVCVYHHIHVRTPHRYIPKLFVTNVPPGVGEPKLADMLDSYYDFQEFGIPWANYEMQWGIKDAPPEIKRAWRDGTVETISFDCLSDDDDLPD